MDFLFTLDLRAQFTGGAREILQLNNEAAEVNWEVAAQPFGDDNPVAAANSLPFLGAATRPDMPTARRSGTLS